mmetsp:Transcript_24596/g.27363  ORF Transcript_24596/g.27363 Transcript_24596/m.27363 type:complete len:475 (+) Transcript_24596:94-1518(+)
MQSDEGKANENLWNALWGYVLGTDATGETDELKDNEEDDNDSESSHVLATAIKDVSNVTLSLWDNVSGPRFEKLWISPLDKSTPEDRMYASRYTLGSELVSDGAHMEMKFQVVPERKYFSHSRLFRAQYRGALTLFALSVAFPLASLPHYLRLHHIIQDRVKHLVIMYMYLLRKTNEEKALEVFDAHVPIFMKEVDNLFAAGPQPAQFHKTIFQQQASNKTDLAFLAKAVTSHLQTHGSTVVIGNDVQSLESYLESLSFFLVWDEKKRACTRVDRGRGYIPDLLLQGIIADSIPDEEIIKSMLPTTLVDLNNMTVKQTHPYHEYSVLRREYLKRRNHELVVSGYPVPGNFWNAAELFRPVKKGSLSIENIMHGIYKLPIHLREGYIHQSMRLLNRRALLLIKYVEALLKASTEDRVDVLDPNAVKKIRQDLGLTETCFTVLLGIAEKLQPGIYVKLVGDPGMIEAKFIELFENF